jgi:anti-anti-sigma factor
MVRFRFTSPEAMTLEIPVSLEQELSEYVDTHRGDVEQKRLIIDLQELPAVSSRQLGTMLTIRKICDPIGEVELAGVSEGVRYLLHLTKMSKYFNLSDTIDE